ncbi:glycosyltransferase family 4 protein [Candidatus Uhrbacteria bacterium]|nr:glycosyltransferase family 4 protein [Candidatus Uhrbacteria bacterium]
MSRIFIDCRCLQSPPPRGGVGVVAEQLTRHLLAIDRTNEYLLFANGLGNTARHLPPFEAPNARWHITHWPNKVWNGVACGPRQLPRLPDADVVFLPNLNFLPPLHPRTRFVVMVHDLSFAHFPECFTPKQRLWHRCIRPAQLLARAHAIVAVSHTTAHDIVDTYGILEQRIHVISPGLTPAPVSATHPIDERYRLPSRFLLTLSAGEPRKNIDGCIAAFARAATIPELRNLHLVIAGIAGSATRALRRIIAHSPVRNRIHCIGPIPESEKHALYAHAECFVYPSIWEGFGIPPLEAMMAGTPVVSSTGGALPEILGDAALLVDPLDPGAIARAIIRACTNPTLRSTLITRGHHRASRFRWEDAATRLHHLLTA